MKILWVSNVMISPVAIKFNANTSTSGGWVDSLYKKLIKDKSTKAAICFPYNTNEIIDGEVDNVKYYAFTKERNNITHYSKRVEDQFRTIISDFKPDIVHIFGTEFPHSLAAVKAFNNPNKTVINIQGLCSIIEKHYYAGLPQEILNKKTLRDSLTKNSVADQRRKFYLRGEFEKIAIRNVNNIIGRTDWDRACTMLINEKINYFSVNESLRDVFYSGKWKLDDDNKYKIFMSQGNYSIKGLHLAIEAMNIVVKKYPNAKLFVAGTNIIRNKTVKDKLKRTAYSKYIEKEVNNYDLHKNIVFTGRLNDKEMYDRYLNSHIYILPSSIENSPNSLGEAMILGLPCIAANVGGVNSLISHENEGFLYQYDATYMLAYYILKIFGNENLANNLSVNAINRAKETHDRDKNISNLLRVYKEINNEKR